MPYLKGRTYYDADSHIMELGDWIGKYADPDIRSRLAPIDLGLVGPLADGAFENVEHRRNDPEAMKFAEETVLSAKAWMALGSTDPTERSRALDLMGLDAQLVFSTLGMTQVVGKELGKLAGRNVDLELLYGGARAHNRAMADFCSQDRRLIPVGFAPWGDPQGSVQLAREAIEGGCGALWIPSAPPADASPSHPDYDPLWALLEEAKVPFLLHVGGGGSRFIDPVFYENGRPKPPDLTGGGENVRAKDIIAIPHSVEIFLGCMALDGVFEKFPGLRGGVIEQGAGWVIPFLQRLDFAHDQFRKIDPAIGKLPLRPAEYIRRQVKFTPFPREPVGWMIQNGGADLFLFSTDFPHPEGTKDPLGLFEKTMDGISEADKERFYSKNFATLLGWA